MAGQTLETMIVINATVGNGFSEIGNTLTQLGAWVDGLSQKLINFGKDSIAVYEDYEKNMAEARVALSTIYGRDTKALDDVMKQLDISATNWASTTIFHTDDVSNAITEAARAGWNYEQIMKGIPVAMQLAQAGSIDLSEALYYITESAKAGGIAFDDLGTFVDLWSFAANSSNGTVESFGDSLLKLGATARFTDSKEELFSLIALMHDMGESGSTAATLLRTSMMRILAPSGVAGSVMEQLGATDEEINAIREDSSKLAALKTLEDYGFSAFDDQGQAKPILQIYSELGSVLAEIAGGYENITKNQTTLGVLGTIFGTRGITGALDIVTALEHATELYDQMMNGDAVGYGEYASETMMDTYYGAIETWESKVEHLKQRTGEALTDQLEPVLETVGGIADGLSSLDTGSFNALVSGAEVLAFAGPGLLLTGGAFRAVGNAIKLFGGSEVAAGIAGVSLAVIGITELISVMNAFEEADYAAQFGEMGLDDAAMMSYIEQVNADFEKGMENVNAYKDALDAAVESYKTASSEFKSSLTQDVITGLELTEGSPEYEKIKGYGETMISALREGIEDRTAESMAFVNELWGGDPEHINDPIWTQITAALNEGYEDAIAQAETLGKNLRQALINAISNDGKIDAGELANIQSIIDEMNRLMAEQAEVDNYVKQQEILRKAQTLGLEATEGLLDDMQAVNESNLELLYRENDRAYAEVRNGLDKQVERGEIDENTRNMLLNEQQKKADEYIYSRTAANEKAMYDLLNLRISGSDLGDAWAEAQTLAQNYWQNGGIANQEAIDEYNSRVSGLESGRIYRYVEDMVYRLGGYDNLRGRADYYESQGDAETAQGFKNVMALFDMLGGRDAGNIGVVQAGVRGAGDYSSGMTDIEQINALLRGHGSTDTFETLAGYLITQQNAGMEAEWQAFLGNDKLYRDMLRMADERGMSISDIIAKNIPEDQTIADWNVLSAIATKTGEIERMRGEISQYGQSGNASAEGIDAMHIQQIEADIVVRQNELAELYSGSGLEIPVTPYVEGTDGVESLRDQGIQVQVNGDTTELQATIDGADGQNLMTYIDGDATNLYASIDSADGQHITTIVDGDVSQVQSALDSLKNQTVSVTIRANTASIPGATGKGFATGGRATEPSIFGEGNTAEWAIPEEHSERTAELLNEARAASGFSWSEIINRYGGLNANPNNVPTTLVYSPTIYAQDAEGVTDKLIEDKARLEKWFAEKQMLDKAEVYA